MAQAIQPSPQLAGPDRSGGIPEGAAVPSAASTLEAQGDASGVLRGVDTAAGGTMGGPGGKMSARPEADLVGGGPVPPELPSIEEPATDKRRGARASQGAGSAPRPGLVLSAITARGADLWTPAIPDQAVVDAAAATLTDAENGTHRLVIGPGVIASGRRPPSPEAQELARKERERRQATTESASAQLGLPVIDPPKRGRVRGWSPASRARMVRTLAELEWSPILRPDRVPVMLTLTLPGDWLTVAPTAEDWKRHIKALRLRWERRWGEPLIGAWKQEFQRRGAPHLHVMTCLPPGSALQSWLSATWAEVVAHPDPEERARHERAGTGLDVAAGLRSSDPRRVAIYFSKHGLYSDKGYQDDPPAEWEGSTGRVWGYWGLSKATAEVVITHAEAVEVQRLLRRWQRAQHVRVKVRVRRLARPAVVDPRTGEVAQAAVYRFRWSHARMGGSTGHKGAAGGGFKVVNDGPRVAEMVARYLAARR